jgi:hypothetical protein
MFEEREIYFEKTEKYANGFYPKDLLATLGKFEVQ